MYQFHYDYIERKYPGDRSKLLFTDTDNLCYLLETPDVYSDFHQDESVFDFSNYDKDHFCYSTENQKVIGKFKDELCGATMEEFVGLKAKMYSIKYSKEQRYGNNNDFTRLISKEDKKAKGVKTNVTKNVTLL